MVKKPEIINLNQKQLKELVLQVKKALPEKEAAIIVAMIDTLTYIFEKLEQKDVQIKSLLKRIFGIKSEKAKKILNNNKNDEENYDDSKLEENASEDANTIMNNDQNKVSNHSTDEPQEQEEEKKKKSGGKKGHGRNGVDKFPGANVIFVPHECLKSGDPCPGCPKGKVYKQKPGVFLYIKGNAPVDATIYKKEKFRCNLCGAIYEAKLPDDLPQEQGKQRYYDESSKTIMIMLRYGYGFPSNRIESFQNNLGLPLPSATQYEKIEEAANTMHPVFNLLQKKAAQGDILYNDDTGGKILSVMKQIKEEQEQEGKGRTGIFTTSIIAIDEEGHTIGLFFTGRQHAGENTEDICKSRTRGDPPILMSDAKPGNVPKNIEVIESNCNTHARRYFANIVDDYPSECQYVIVDVFGEIYKNERTIKKSGMTPAERLEYHQKHSGPIMDDFYIWLNKQINKQANEQPLVEPNSSLGKAIKYVLKHWENLTRFLHVEGVPLDNNICERAIKTAIYHRKNSLFYKNEHGAFIGDMFMSLIHTCALNGVNAFDYLTELQKNSSKVFKNPSEWLPWNYKESLKNYDESIKETKN